MQRQGQRCRDLTGDALQVYQTDDGSLRHVRQAVKRGRIVKCAHCHAVGATVGCLVKACHASYHVWCAHKAQCCFDEDSYTVACPAHARILINSRRQHKGDGGSDVWHGRAPWIDIADEPAVGFDPHTHGCVLTYRPRENGLPETFQSTSCGH
jgi:hypothetical protein